MDYRYDNRNLTKDEIRERKQSEAVERQEAHDKLTPQQKLDKLDKRFGTGVGAKRERAKLKRVLEECHT